jgi:hypothetical protein
MNPPWSHHVWIAPVLNAFSGEQKSSGLEDFFEFLRRAGGLLFRVSTEASASIDKTGIRAYDQRCQRGTEHALWRRLRLIPFKVTIPDD